jgi:hypothetical protein
MVGLWRTLAGPKPKAEPSVLTASFQDHSGRRFERLREVVNWLANINARLQRTQDRKSPQALRSLCYAQVQQKRAVATP